MSTSQDLRVGVVTTAQQLAEASGLYRRVFGYSKPEASLNPRLLMAMIANGGSAVGAWNRDGDLVAFGYGFPGVTEGEYYFYSQAVVVSDGLQGTGVGRRIKAEQRRVALEQDLHHMRWAFNPVLARNAHFNLSVLGGVGRWFVPDCYGDGESRMLIDWNLDAPDLPDLRPWDTWTQADWSHAAARGGVVAVPVPADKNRADARIVEQLDATLAPLFEAGLVARACLRQDADTDVYLFSAPDTAAPIPATGASK